jgi:hypothetical protein
MYGMANTCNSRSGGGWILWISREAGDGNLTPQPGIGNYLSDISRFGRNTRGIRKFMWGEGGRFLSRMNGRLGVEQMQQRFKVILTLLVLAAMLVIFLVIPMFLLRR